jgi:RNA polymerase sigma-70 factor (ECF subfamily)
LTHAAISPTEADPHVDLPSADHARPADASSAAAVPFSPEALFTLMIDHRDRLENFVYRQLNNDADCAKIVDQIWVELAEYWTRRTALRAPENLLYQRARLRCIDRLRKVGRHPQDLADDIEAQTATAAALVTNPEFEAELVMRIDLRAALAAVPVRQRQALVMTYGYQLPSTVVAGLLGCTRSKVEHLLRTGKANLTTSVHLAGYRPVVPSAEVHR